MRLTADVIEKSASFFNPLKERELDLRGNKIPAIENLIATKDQYDLIDLTDNEIKKVENFPRLNRLSSLFLSNNAISKIEETFFSPRQLPALHTLILSNNRLLNFGDLEALRVFQEQLKHLSLLENPVAKKPNYRLFVLSLLPKLRTLDFKRVRPAEITEAIKMFGDSHKSTFEPGAELEESERPSKHARLGLTSEQTDKIKEAIKQAKTLAEVNRLEKILETGHIPDAEDLAFLDSQ